MSSAILNYLIFLIAVLMSYPMQSDDTTVYRRALKRLDDSNVVIETSDDGNTCVYHNGKTVLLVVSGLWDGQNKNNSHLQFFVPTIGRFVSQRKLLRGKNNKLYDETVFLVRPGLRPENLESLFGSPFRDIGSGAQILCWELESGQSIQLHSTRAGSTSSPSTLNTCSTLCSTNQLGGEIVKLFTIAIEPVKKSKASDKNKVPGAKK